MKLSQRDAEIKSSWKLVYRNPFIFPISFMVRLKVYHTAFCILVSTVFCYQFIEGSLSESELILYFVALVVVLLLLVGYSVLYRRLVGRIYISNDSKSVRLAHVNFWGKREDVTLPIKKIIPISDTNDKLNTFHIKIGLNNSAQTYYMNFGRKAILDPEAFALIFGHRPHPSFYDDIAFSDLEEKLKKSHNEPFVIKSKSNVTKAESIESK